MNCYPSVRKGTRDRARGLQSGHCLDDVAAGFLIFFEVDEPPRPRFLEQVAEAAEAVVRLVEARSLALDRLLDHRAPDLLVLVTLVGERFDRREHEIERLLLALVLGFRRAVRRGC